MPNTSRMSADKLREYARTGAEMALKRLRAEIVAIERTFPELALPRRRHALRRSLKQAETSFREAEQRTRRVSAAARKAVSERMKKYWAERKKAQAKIKQAKIK